MKDYTKLMSLDGKNIVVCGGSGLIGSSVAEACQQLGANILIADLEPKKNSNLSFVEFDLGNKASVQTGMTQILKRFDQIHGWVNLAYPKQESWGLPMEAVTQESWDWHLSTHLGGYFWTSQAVLKHMKNHGDGALINFASIYGVVGPNFNLYTGLQISNPPAYAAIKGAIVNMTKYLAAYYGKCGVRVNCISPGGILDGQDPAFIERYNSLTPLNRMGEPDDIVGGCIFLLGDSSAYITGHNLMIDGGWSVI